VSRSFDGDKLVARSIEIHKQALITSIFEQLKRLENSGSRETRMHQKLLQVIALLMVAATCDAAQTEPLITNEYRFTQIVSKPVSDKIVLFTYSGYTRSPEKEFRSIYGSPPNMIYILRPGIEFLVGMVAVYTRNDDASHSWEIRPVLGAKFYLPNKWKMQIYSFTRFENRFIIQNRDLQSIPRIRNRVGLEAPLAKGEKAWKPKSFYTLADIEPIWRLDEKRLQVLRLRGGLGYIFNRTVRAEFIYHLELSGTDDSPLDHTGNIWRLNLKVLLPRHGFRYPKDVDID